MYQLLRSKLCGYAFSGLVIFFAFFAADMTYAAEAGAVRGASIDRIEFVKQQISLLATRLTEEQGLLSELQKQHENDISQIALEKSSKNLLNKAALDIIVAKSRTDSINLEITDAEQTVSWLEKSVQEIENQLNVLSIFGRKFAKTETQNENAIRQDLQYQKKLLTLERSRLDQLYDLKSVETLILQYRNETLNRLNALLKTYRLLHVKQRQVKDELDYQALQSQKLSELNGLYNKIKLIDPSNAKTEFAELERQIFFVNETANYAYARSLLARYNDQFEQMRLLSLRGNAANFLNETREQLQVLTKQLARVIGVVDTREKLLDKRVQLLSKQFSFQTKSADYLTKLKALNQQYKKMDQSLAVLNQGLVQFRITLDHALQQELSSRQGLPAFDGKMLLDLGRELLLVPVLTFQIIKSLSAKLAQGFANTSILGWSIFIMLQGLLFCAYRKKLLPLLGQNAAWRQQLNLHSLLVETIARSLLQLILVFDFLWSMYFFAVPYQNFSLIFYLLAVWLIVRLIMIVARICLVETTHDTTGHDVKLHARLKWVFLVGGVITAVTVYIHQLPLVFELKSLCDRLFLLLLMLTSLLMMKSWHVVPHLILSHSENKHPYLEKSIRFVGFLIPALMFANAVIGLLGYLNLVMTIARYEGIFLLVLTGYLCFSGLLADLMEWASNLMIKHVSNGWLLTEAFLKPLDTILRIALFLSAWIFLFLLFGWDKRSPIVERLTGILHYHLVNILNTTITPLSIIEVAVLISIFYWTAKWTREFVYRFLLSRTKDMGIRNSLAILSQYSVIVVGIFLCLRVLGIDLRALAVVAGMLAFGIGLGLRDLANNFASGFLILLERPLRVGDIVNVNNIEGEVTHIGGRAVTICTGDNIELMVPNTEIYNKSFSNLTAHDNIVRTLTQVKISRYDNPHQVKNIIQDVLLQHSEVLKEPAAEVMLKNMSDIHMEFQIRFHVNMKQVKSRTRVTSEILMKVWDAFNAFGIKPPYPQHEVFLHHEREVEEKAAAPKSDSDLRMKDDLLLENKK